MWITASWQNRSRVSFARMMDLQSQFPGRRYHGASATKWDSVISTVITSLEEMQVTHKETLEFHRFKFESFQKELSRSSLSQDVRRENRTRKGELPEAEAVFQASLHPQCLIHSRSQENEASAEGVERGGGDGEGTQANGGGLSCSFPQWGSQEMAMGTNTPPK